MKVTAQMLRDNGACEYQVKIFEKEWPDGTRITKKACLRAAELELDLDWFAVQFLTKRHLKAYDKADATAMEVCNKALAPAWEAYEKARALALWEASKVK